MLNKQSAFDRYNRAIQAGVQPDARDRAELEARAAEMHNHYPQKIDALNADLKETKQALDAARDQLDAATESIIQAVAMAKDPETRKPVYSNETLRGIEIKKRTATDQRCAQLAEQIVKLQEKWAFETVLLERARHDYSAWRDMFKLELAAVQ